MSGSNYPIPWILLLVDVTTVAHDALKESDARFVAAKIKAKKICAHKFPQYSLFTSAVHMRNLVELWDLRVVE
uniref:Uncharacterized protein n=1 Tax=Salix viminalis TaxID=40686 RepID=A0A6N2NGN4_SALVM